MYLEIRYRGTTPQQLESFVRMRAFITDYTIMDVRDSPAYKDVFYVYDALSDGEDSSRDELLRCLQDLVSHIRFFTNHCCAVVYVDNNQADFEQAL